MAKNTQTGAAVALALTAVTYEGTVLSVTKTGVKMATRDLGKQTTVDRFFGMADIVSFTNEGEGKITVMENRMIAGAYGEVTEENGVITVDIGEKRSVSFSPTAGVSIRVDYDSESGLSSTNAKLAKRDTDKLGTAMRRLSERAAGGAKKTKKKTKK